MTTSAKNVQVERQKLVQLKELLQMFSPESEKTHFSRAFNPSSRGDKIEMVPGFKMAIPVHQSVSAELLKKIFSDTGGSLPYAVKLSLSDDRKQLYIQSDGDVYQSIMKTPRYSPAVDLERFVRYSVFRAVCSQLAKHRIYNMSIDKKNRNSYAVPCHPVIDEIIAKYLTKQDIDKMGAGGGMGIGYQPKSPAVSRSDTYQNKKAGADFRPPR